MKRFLFVALVALGLTAATRSAKADCAFEYSCSRHFSYVHTSKSRCFTFNSHSNPLPCLGGHCGYSGPAAWDGFAGYGAPAYGVAAAPAAAPAAAAPAAKTPDAKSPSFNAPQPKENANGVQQTGYFYYGQTPNPGYSAGYTYGGYSYYGYGTGPNYWYDN
jgi:hypothetical protein